MVEKRTLGEAKEGTCESCRTPFEKRRYDQRFCSPECGAKWWNHQTEWKDRSDRDLQNANRRQHYKRNREFYLERNKTWRKENPDKARALDKEKYERNKPAHQLRATKYRAEHPELRHKEYLNARKKCPWMQALTNARHRSLKKGFPFDLTREWCEQNWTGTCAITGLPFSFGTQKHFPFSPSVDRIKSDLGYTTNNCRFVLFAVNSFKGTGTDEDMLLIARAIVQKLALVMP